MFIAYFQLSSLFPYFLPLPPHTPTNLQKEEETKDKKWGLQVAQGQSRQAGISASRACRIQVSMVTAVLCPQPLPLSTPGPDSPDFQRLLGAELHGAELYMSAHRLAVTRTGPQACVV